MLTLNVIFDAFDYGLTGVLLFIDSIVYWLVSKLFGVFSFLANPMSINELFYTDIELIAKRIEVVIGVVMLFFVASALLKALVDPDNLNKNASKIVKNALISIILLGVFPVIFTYAFKLQDVIIGDHVVEKLLFGNDSETPSVGQIGNETALNVFSAFLVIPDDVEADKSGITWGEMKEGIKVSGAFLDITAMLEPIKDNTYGITYTPIVSTACGIFLIYILVSFCIDLGIRVFKLAFYQIIAPIPILMYIIPEKKSVFDNWIKATLATYLEVFIRLFVMFAVVFLAQAIFINWKDWTHAFEKVIVIMGLFAFAKQAPKLISDVLGIDSGNMKLGIMGKLATGGALGMGAVAGAGLLTGSRNFFHGIGNTANRISNIKNEKGGWNKFKAGVGAAGAAVGTLGSTVAGAASGMVRGVPKGFSAKNVKDTGNAISGAVQGATEARDKRDNYQATHGGIIGATAGHVGDAIKNVGGFLGISSTDQIKAEQNRAQELADAQKAVADRAKAIMEKQKNERMATNAIDVADIGAYKNLAELEADITYAQQNGMTTGGAKVDASKLREMLVAKTDLEKQLQKDIVAGLDKNGVLDVAGYDGDLMSAVTTYRTKLSMNYNSILQNADQSIAKVKDAMINLQTANAAASQKINDFISSGNVSKLFDGKDAIENANRKLRVDLNAKILKEKESKK